MTYPEDQPDPQNPEHGLGAGPCGHGQAGSGHRAIQGPDMTKPPQTATPGKQPALVTDRSMRSPINRIPQL